MSQFLVFLCPATEIRRDVLLVSQVRKVVFVLRVSVYALHMIVFMFECYICFYVSVACICFCRCCW